MPERSFSEGEIVSDVALFLMEEMVERGHAEWKIDAEQFDDNQTQEKAKTQGDEISGAFESEGDDNDQKDDDSEPENVGKDFGTANFDAAQNQIVETDPPVVSEPEEINMIRVDMFVQNGDKIGLDEYAASCGYKLDRRKSIEKMASSLQEQAGLNAD